MATIPGSTTVGGFVAPSDTNDTYPAHTEEYGRGGYRSVADIAERDAITAARRKEGMKVRVLETDAEWLLGPGLTNTDWYPVPAPEIPEFPDPVTLTPRTVAGNPGVATGPPLSVPLTGGLFFDTSGKLSIGGAETWRNKTIHIYRRTDLDPVTGLIVVGTGTINDPYDGSTAARITAILGPLSTAKTPCNVIWGPGIFEIPFVDPTIADASNPVYFRDGWHWEGAGIGRTILRCPAANRNGPRYMVASSRAVGDTNFVWNGSIRRLTFDGQVTSNNADIGLKFMNAVLMEANDFLLEECACINMGGSGQEINPIVLTNGINGNGTGGDPARPCHLAIRRCIVDVVFAGSQSAGILISGLPPATANNSTPQQRCSIEDCWIRDCYITFSNFRNVNIVRNYVNVRNAKDACIKCAGGDNQQIRIQGNTLVGAGSASRHVGTITIGAPDTGVFRDFIIADNYLENINYGMMTTGINIRGRCFDLRISNNTWKALPGITYGLIDDSAMPPPWAPGNGLAFDWTPPPPGNESGPRMCWANQHEVNGTVPLGMENTMRGVIKGLLEIHTDKAFTALNTILGYGELLLGHTGKNDPYAVATIGLAGNIRTTLEVVNEGAGAAVLRLVRLGGVPSRWDDIIPGNQTYRDWIHVPETGPEVVALRAHITGYVDVPTPDARLSADVVYPRKGLYARSGADWPVAADYPQNTGGIWHNSTTNTSRYVYNQAGTMQYSPVFASIP